MFLGGYNSPNTAKLWTSLTALAVDIELNNNIPEHNHWPKYGPDYTLIVQPLLAKDLNTRQYIENCLNIVRGKYIFFMKSQYFTTKYNRHFL